MNGWSYSTTHTTCLHGKDRGFTCIIIIIIIIIIIMLSPYVFTRDKCGPEDLGIRLQSRSSSGKGGFRTLSGAWAGVYGQSSRNRLGISLGKHATVFQAEIYAILACVYGIQTNARSEKCISICSDSQGALEATRTAKTTSPLVQQRQKALNISNHYSVRLFWIPGHSGGGGNETAEEFAREGTFH